MGSKQRTLERLLREKGRVTRGKLAFPKKRHLVGSDVEEEVLTVYRRLGGRLPESPLRLRGWDLEFEGVAVELDEALHFNRYRAATLESPVYRRLVRFPLEAYRRYCKEREDACLRSGAYGGKWSNASCVKQFGEGAPEGDLTGNGAPRWKQRAFYDFVKDLSEVLTDVRVVRISVWDTVVEGGRQRLVNDVLRAPSDESAEGLAALVRMRAGEG